MRATPLRCGSNQRPSWHSCGFFGPIPCLAASGTHWRCAGHRKSGCQSAALSHGMPPPAWPGTSRADVTVNVTAAEQCSASIYMPPRLESESQQGPMQSVSSVPA